MMHISNKPCLSHLGQYNDRGRKLAELFNKLLSGHWAYWYLVYFVVYQNVKWNSLLNIGFHTTACVEWSQWDVMRFGDLH